MISTKGRYALRVMIDLAEHREQDRVPLKDIAERQEGLLHNPNNKNGAFDH